MGSAMSDDEWYYAHDGEAMGPFALRDLKAGLAKIPDGQNVRVWRDGFDGWQRAGDLAEFAEPAVAPGPSPKARPAQSRPSAKQAARQKPARRRSIGMVLGGVVLLAIVGTAGFFGKLIIATVHELVPKPSRSARPVAAPVDKTLEEKIVKNFEGFEATLPKKVDNLTTLVSAKHEGATVTFGYRVDVDGSRLGDQVKAKVREIATKDICAETRSREILDLGGSFHLDYVDKNEKPVTAVDIAKSNCS
jgi:predicted RNA-binding protein with TRAM domain